MGRIVGKEPDQAVGKEPGQDIIDLYGEAYAESLNFTRRSEEAFYGTVDLADFQDQDAETIYSCLIRELRPIPFCDYLKRYIYLNSGMRGNFLEIDQKIYQEAIALAFAENNAPCSLTETTSRLSALSKNWLSQESISRQNVFLLGFGLGMTLDEVSSFLTKALKERDFNFKDPFEIIFWYCFNNGYKYPKFLELKNRFEEMSRVGSGSIYGNRTMGIRQEAASIYDDESLMGFLAVFTSPLGKSPYSVTTEQVFRGLYHQTKTIIAGYYNLDEEEKPAKTRKTWTPENITEADVERILCSGTPYDSKGNLVRVSVSKLAKYFSKRRLSRQHLHDILTAASAIDRFDLITLNFFLFSQDKRYETDNKGRLLSFVESTNSLLEECGMGEIYIANPYESFLLMCILSDCPLATYADVWEMSFEEES